MSASRNNFLRSNSFGNMGESYISTYLGDRGFPCHKDEKIRLEYDLVCQVEQQKVTLEIKYDIMAKRTGNIAIEFHNSKQNKPSGIYATQADFWVILLNDDGHSIYVTPTQTLKDFIVGSKPKRIVYGGGDDNADLLLYSKEQILPEIFISLKEISTDNLRSFFLDNLNAPTRTINDQT